MENSTFENLRKKVSTIVPLPHGEMEYFLSKVDCKVVSKNELIINEGDTCAFIVFVEKGILRTFLSADDKEVNTEFFIENTFAGAFTSFLLNTATSLNIQAMEDCTLFYIQKSLLTDLYKRNPLWFALGKNIFETEFIKKCKRESSLLQQTAKQRYLSLLEEYPGIEGRIPLFHIASYLGIQPESLSRIRSGNI